MEFGVRKKDAPPRRERSPISWFGKEDTRVRFLEEIEDWVEINQHFSASARSPYPCSYTEEERREHLPNHCPGCNSANEQEAKPALRYIANLVDIGRGTAELYVVPYSLIKPLERYSDKDGGTIMARDYTIVQWKEDGFTKYGAEKEEREKLNLDKYELKDAKAALKKQWQMVWGDNDSPEAQERAAKDSKVVTVEDAVEKKRPYIERIKPEPQEEEKPARKRAAPGVTKPRNMRESIQAKEDDDPPSEPQQESDAAEETITMSEDQIRDMSMEELEALYLQCGIDLPDSDDDLADYLINALTEE